mmetsp:Transcript_1861/g.7067  ORF Transcript_1861/g.7067 Transcript_1861/m.7067 type:complete len:220 (-) Transcript_1861:867-1526(-)
MCMYQLMETRNQEILKETERYPHPEIVSHRLPRPHGNPPCGWLGGGGGACGFFIGPPTPPIPPIGPPGPRICFGKPTPGDDALANPVAMMVTDIVPLYFSSTTEPKITFASGSANDVTTSETALISCNVRSVPPVMLNTIPVARSIDCSIKGADIAAIAASVALFFPCATPTPNIAVPESFITARTSAKSMFTNPEMVMISLMPCTPCRNTSSASRKAS